MTFDRARQNRSAFTLAEVLVATGVFGLFVGGLLTTWTALQTSAVNTTTYARRQNDQMRVIDYLKRDIRRASAIEIYDGGTLVTGTAFGNELRLTLPDYYSDSREEDDSFGPRTPTTPTVTGSDVSYGTALTVRYCVTNGAIVREESGMARTVADAAGAFEISFSRETSGQVRCRVIFDQPMRSGGNRKLRREVDVLCGQRAQLQL